MSTDSNVNFDMMRMHDLEHQLIRLSDKINHDTGFYWWKRYTYSAFWSVVSNPINLAITIFTALTTSQNGSTGFLSEYVVTVLGIVTLVLSAVNTFFRPGQQLIMNQTIKEKWSNFGVEFEEIYFSSTYTNEEKIEKLKKYERLFENISALKKGTDSNYFIDLIFLCMRYGCLKPEKLVWIPNMKEKFLNEKQKTSSQTSSMHGCLSPFCTSPMTCSLAFNNPPPPRLEHPVTHEENFLHQSRDPETSSAIIIYEPTTKKETVTESTV